MIDALAEIRSIIAHSLGQWVGTGQPSQEMPVVVALQVNMNEPPMTGGTSATWLGGAGVNCAGQLPGPGICTSTPTSSCRMAALDVEWEARQYCCQIMLLSRAALTVGMGIDALLISSHAYDARVRSSCTSHLPHSVESRPGKNEKRYVMYMYHVLGGRATHLAWMLQTKVIQLCLATCSLECSLICVDDAAFNSFSEEHTR